jgi:hypothetical protein
MLPTLIVTREQDHCVAGFGSVLLEFLNDRAARIWLFRQDRDPWLSYPL